MKRKTVVIYDCDGVLFDSRRSTRAFYDSILERFGLPVLTDRQAAFCYFSTTRDALEVLFKDSSSREEAYAYALGLNNDPFLSLMDMEPHLRETLASVRQIHYTAIATNRGRSVTQVLREFGLEEMFDHVVTSLQVERPKPDPECLLKIMGRFNAEPRDALYVGDADVDRRTAESAGVAFVAYKNPSLPARAHIEDHLELVPLLATLFGPSNGRL